MSQALVTYLPGEWVELVLVGKINPSSSHGSIWSQDKAQMSEALNRGDKDVECCSACKSKSLLIFNAVGNYSRQGFSRSDRDVANNEPYSYTKRKISPRKVWKQPNSVFPSPDSSTVTNQAHTNQVVPTSMQPNCARSHHAVAVISSYDGGGLCDRRDFIVQKTSAAIATRRTTPPAAPPAIMTVSLSPLPLFPVSSPPEISRPATKGADVGATPAVGAICDAGATVATPAFPRLPAVGAGVLMPGWGVLPAGAEVIVIVTGAGVPIATGDSVRAGAGEGITGAAVIIVGGAVAVTGAGVAFAGPGVGTTVITGAGVSSTST